MRILQWPAAVLLLLLTSPAISQSQHRRLEDSSDWWSLLKEFPAEPGRAIKELRRKHFRIAGVTFSKDDYAKGGFQKIRSRFGEAINLERGDAAAYRDQICYVSPIENIHLIFEVGEVDSTVYLFEGGPKWKGSELCATAPGLAAGISTASGLRLGLDRRQVRALLGSPSLATPDKFVHSFSFKMKTAAADLSELRRTYPDLNDRDFHKDFTFADVQAAIVTRFTSGKLTYLAIMRSDLIY